MLSSAVLTWPRVLASALALGLTLLVQLAIRASHPPAAATALLVSLGGIRPDALRRLRAAQQPQP